MSSSGFKSPAWCTSALGRHCDYPAKSMTQGTRPIPLALCNAPVFRRHTLQGANSQPVRERRHRAPMLLLCRRSRPRREFICVRQQVHLHLSLSDTARMSSAISRFHPFQAPSSSRPTGRMTTARSLPGLGHRLDPRNGLARWIAGFTPSRARSLLRHGAPAEETVIAKLGHVQIRRIEAGAVARTTVSGECQAALRIGLERLAEYTSGDNHQGLPVPAVTPVIQRSAGPGRWSVEIGLKRLCDPSGAPAPFNRKVRIVHQPSETLAILLLAGRPVKPAAIQGEAALLASITGTQWLAIGAPLLRLRGYPSLLPWTREFEVAIPVSAIHAEPNHRLC